MMIRELQRKETCLTETLLSALDARETARETGSTMLVYLADLFVTRVQEELLDVRGAVEEASRRSAASDPAA